MNKQLQKYKQAKIANASHGDFFFASWATSDGYVRESPCFVLSNPNYKDPYNEIVVLKVSTDPSTKSEFDIPVTLKDPSHVRTNKIYTIQKSQLHFPIPQTTTPQEYIDIIEKVKVALKIDQ